MFVFHLPVYVWRSTLYSDLGRNLCIKSEKVDEKVEDVLGQLGHFEQTNRTVKVDFRHRFQASSLCRNGSPDRDRIKRIVRVQLSKFEDHRSLRPKTRRC